MKKAKDPSASKEVEAWFEYTPSHKSTIENGLKVISDPDDPRWDGEMKQPPFRAGADGYLQVAEVIRVDGEMVKKTIKIGRACHANFAREFLIQFRDAKNAGAERPWDLEQHFRSHIAEAKRAAEEGRAADLEKFQTAIVAALTAKAGVA